MRREIVRLSVMGLCVAVVLVGCTAATAMRNLSPIQPLESYTGQFADIVVDTTTTPEPTLEITRENVTVRVQYWRKYELDRRFNKGTSASAFLSEPTWKQSEQVDVWWVSIKNGRNKPLRVSLSDLHVEDDVRLRADMEGNIYITLDAEENRRRIYNKQGQTLDIRKGLDEIRPHLFETHIQRGEIAPGESSEGYVPFYKIKPNAPSFVLRIPVEAATEGAGIGRYQKVTFAFPYKFDRTIYEAQPATIRY
jgi:hypothetical protein